MNPKEHIDSDLKKALLAGEKDKALVLRGLKSAILNAEIAAGKRETGLDEAEIAALLQKEIKSRKETAELYIREGEQTRANQEMSEIAVIEAYLPKQLSDDELASLVTAAIEQTGGASLQQMGQIIGHVKQQAGAGADGSRIAKVVKERLSQ